MCANLTQSIEDYIRAIYDLTSSGKRATTNALADKMNVTPASVTGMIQRLVGKDLGLVEYEKHRGVTLTKAGEAVALRTIRHHRLLELFLHTTLGYEWHEVHAEADRLEHVISEDMEERIAQALGNPSRDPHGEPIPGRDLRLPPSSSLRLSQVRPGQRVYVERVEASDLDLLQYLGKIGLFPRVELTVLDYSAFDENLRLQVNGQNPIVLGPRVTSQVFVKLVNE
jgi:DtxR family transcriptional regulator, Mn-dependent transcriptional regulator